jgi:PleD family two-component response regulator
VVRPSLENIALDRRVDARPADEFDPSLLRNLRVLVVDEEDDARVLLETMLAQYGADVRTASSVEEAFVAFERSPADIARLGASRSTSS